MDPRPLPIEQIKAIPADLIAVREGHAFASTPKPKRERKWRLRLRRSKKS